MRGRIASIIISKCLHKIAGVQKTVYLKSELHPHLHFGDIVLTVKAPGGGSWHQNGNCGLKIHRRIDLQKFPILPI